MHTKHVMIDIETLSTAPDAAIIAVAMVEFDLEKFISGGTWFLDPVWAEGHRDMDTLKWWNTEVTRQNRDECFSGKWMSRDFASNFWEALRPFREDHWIWAGPSTFDLTILKSFYRRLDMEYPINWRNERDQTTLNNLCEQLGLEHGILRDESGLHNPYYDAKYQAQKVQSYLQQLVILKKELA